ncbi:aspartate--ammonia ligase [Pseudoflavonifractor sp. 524-17]|uniref:aspartate--ammonia ligase n=1 Tax=Pseudoflavonifractor sp. 524-17 TaxID=2304577 RepID=UPI00137AFB6E|nr:aspartate--ammonia ligase [Pseudoflavonifractor sp. 524-17]NCE64742.1 aspartate--ammonia ligase [Pseudoflavonifractor sp. 524-17]
MEKTVIPEGYAPSLNLYDTQKAISLLKRLFEDTLGGALHLSRVSAPLFVEAATGLNDDLNGVERAVSFDIPAAGRDAQVVHSLAKWKRMALYRYQFSVGEGLYTDMNAIRRDEAPDNLHSVYVDQWDWEKVIAPRDRNVEFLKETVRTIVKAICETQTTLYAVYPRLCAVPLVDPEVSFVTAQELEDRWPSLTPKERENAWVKDHPTTFLMGIGGNLASGEPHDGRAPDYDDWSLNGDILLWNPVLKQAFEVSSMGIRVSPEVLDQQLTAAGQDGRRTLTFHKLLLEGKLPLTMGGGIGQSRLCMLLLGKAHIGEVQASVWDPETIVVCRDAGVILL